MRLQVGQQFKLSNDAIENYGGEYQDKVFICNGVFKSKDEHPSFDESAGTPLYEADGLPFAVYGWEVKAP